MMATLVIEVEFGNTVIFGDKHSERKDIVCLRQSELESLALANGYVKASDIDALATSAGYVKVEKGQVLVPEDALSAAIGALIRECGHRCSGCGGTGCAVPTLIAARDEAEAKEARDE